MRWDLIPSHDGTIRLVTLVWAGMTWPINGTSAAQSARCQPKQSVPAEAIVIHTQGLLVVAQGNVEPSVLVPRSCNKLAVLAELAVYPGDDIRADESCPGARDDSQGRC